MSLTVALWGLIVHISASMKCPEVRCGDTQSHVCAKFTPGSVTLQPCLDPAWCDLDALFPAYFAGDTVLVCSQESDSDVKQRYIDTLMEEVCLQTPGPDDKRRLASGSHPLQCSDSADCLLQDGTKTECVCSLGVQGSAYCELAPNDELLKPLYAAACSRSTDAFLREFLYTRHYVHLQDKLPCKAVVFSDIAVFEFLEAGGSVKEYVVRETSASEVLCTLIFAYFL